MEQLFEYLNKTNFQTILGMFIICWYFTRDLKADMRRMHEDLFRQGQRTDKLYEMFIDLLKERKNP